MSYILKTSVVSTFSVLLALAASSNLELNSSFYASITAVVLSQPNCRKVIELGAKRLYSTLVGAVMGLFFYQFLPHHNLAYALGIFCVVYICSKFLKAPYVLAGIVFLAISVNLGELSSSYYALHRMVDTGIGTISTILVTLVFSFIEGRVSPSKDKQYS